jgi:hypothetical protein
MSFFYKKGFFPFPLLQSSRLDSASVAAYDKITGLGLSTLSRLYWSWKTCTITANISYNIELPPPYSTMSLIGSITGTVVATNNAIPATRLDALEGLDLFFAAYTENSHPISYSGTITDVGVQTLYPSGFTNPYSSSLAPPFLNWCQSFFPGSSDFFYSYIVQNSPSDFWTYFQFEMNTGGPLSPFGVVNSNSPPPFGSSTSPTSIQLTIRSPFDNDVRPTPLFFNGSGAGITASSSGTILYDFDSFYTA